MLSSLSKEIHSRLWLNATGRTFFSTSRLRPAIARSAGTVPPSTRFRSCRAAIADLQIPPALHRDRLPLPVRDLIGMHPIMGRDFLDRLLTFDRFQRNS